MKQQQEINAATLRVSHNSLSDHRQFQFRVCVIETKTREKANLVIICGIQRVPSSPEVSPGAKRAALASATGLSSPADVAVQVRESR